MKKKTASLTVVESKSRPNNFYLRLTGANGEKLMFSEVYPNKGNANRARRDHLEAMAAVLEAEQDDPVDLKGYTVLYGTPEERLTAMRQILGGAEMDAEDQLNAEDES